MTERAIGRRSVIATTALGAAGVLAACGSGETTSPQAGGPGGQPASPSAAAISVPVSEVPVGGGTILRTDQVVVTQPSAGTFHAFSAVCPHEQCLVAQVTRTKIICPCHSSQFDISTGALLAGPAPTGLAPRQVSVDGSTLHIS